MRRDPTRSPSDRQPYPSSLATAFSLIDWPKNPPNACQAFGKLVRQMMGGDELPGQDPGYEPRPLQLKPPRWEAQIGF